MSVGAAIALAVGGTLLMAAGLTWMALRFNREYNEHEKAALARLRQELPKRGWTFAPRDDSIVELYNWWTEERTWRNPLEPFVKPPRAKAARDVITGSHRGRPFVAAVLDTHYQGEHVWARCIWVRTPAVRPALGVSKVPALESGINAGPGMGDLRFGNPEFDDKFEVRTGSDAFAAAVLNPAVIRFLLAERCRLRGLRFFGDQFDVSDQYTFDHRDPAELIPALDLRCDILDRIPSAVWAQGA